MLNLCCEIRGKYEISLSRLHAGFHDNCQKFFVEDFSVKNDNLFIKLGLSDEFWM